MIDLLQWLGLIGVIMGMVFIVHAAWQHINDLNEQMLEHKKQLFKIDNRLLNHEDVNKFHGDCIETNRRFFMKELNLEDEKCNSVQKE